MKRGSAARREGTARGSRPVRVAPRPRPGVAFCGKDGYV